VFADGRARHSRLAVRIVANAAQFIQEKEKITEKKGREDFFDGQGTPPCLSSRAFHSFF
jgi:hypothetical protein